MPVNDPNSRPPEYIEPRNCPHCGVSKPYMGKCHEFRTVDGNSSGALCYGWKIFVCNACAYPVIKGYFLEYGAKEIPKESMNKAELLLLPKPKTAHEDIPLKARSFLQQAMESLHAPSGAIMLCASCVDEMLKQNGYTDDTLHSRIGKANDDHLLTDQMKEWADDIKFDANDERHADENAKLPTIDDAKKSLDFATALAEYLFVLPSRVKRKRKPKETK